MNMPKGEYEYYQTRPIRLFMSNRWEDITDFVRECFNAQAFFLYGMVLVVYAIHTILKG